MIPLTRIRSRRDKNCFQISVSALLTHFAGVQTIGDPSLSHLPWGTQSLWSVWAGHQGGLRSRRSTCCGVSDRGINWFAFCSHLGIHRHGGGMGTRAKGEKQGALVLPLFSFHKPHLTIMVVLLGPVSAECHVPGELRSISCCPHKTTVK